MVVYGSEKDWQACIAKLIIYAMKKEDSVYPLSRKWNRGVKRAFDIVFSLVFLCTLFPVLLVIIVIVTECTMPGKLFFIQKRTGWKGRTFRCVKFRTMRENAEADTRQATRTDERITRWGHILRKTNLDEIPQFWNVLMGDMSVVGPRPHMVKQTEEYSRLIGNYMRRHDVRPGVTGWSQVNGFRGETAHLADMESRVKYDLWYIKHWSLWLDLYIVVKTAKTCFYWDEKAY